MENPVAVQDDLTPNQDTSLEFEISKKSNTENARSLRHSQHLLTMFPK